MTPEKSDRTLQVFDTFDSLAVLQLLIAQTCARADEILNRGRAFLRGGMRVKKLF